MINPYESNVYSEETFNVTESDYDEVMQMIGEESAEFAGYSEWSESLEVINESENFIAYSDGRVEHMPEPKRGAASGP